MIVSIAQPAYLPWLGYFHRLAISDLHVVLDDVDIGHRSFANRNKILTANGPAWLTVPVGTKDSPIINQVTVAEDPRWRRKHWSTISQSYATAPYFAEHEKFFAELFERDWRRLVDLLEVSTDHLRQAIGTMPDTVRSSDLNVEGTKAELILNLCREVGATVYVSGPFGRDYLDEDAFRDAGISVWYHDYNHPEYEQGQPEFVPYMSAVDALLRCGPDTLEVITAGNPTRSDVPALAR